MASNIPVPGPYKLNDDWDLFREQYDNYRIATELNKKSAEVQIATLKSVIGTECLAILRHLNLSEDDKKDTKKTLDALEEHFKPKTNVVFERYKFNTCIQGQSESVDSYVSKLRELAATCKFGALLDEMLRDRIVLGCRDDAARGRLFREPDLTLEKTITVLKTSELADQQLSKIAGTTDHVHTVKRQPVKHRDFGRTKQQQQTPKKDETAHHCRRCDTKHVSMQCPAYGYTCGKCRKLHHFTKCCQTKSYQGRRPDKRRFHRKVHEIQEDNQTSEPPDFFVDDIKLDSVTQDYSEEDIILPFTLNGSIVPLKLDCGAQANIISESDYKQLNKRPPLIKTSDGLKGYFNHKIPVVGKCIVTVSYKAASRKLQFFVVPGTHQALLSKSACLSMGLIKLVYGVTVENTPEQNDQEPASHQEPASNNRNPDYDHLFDEYQDVFQGLGCLPGEHTIVVDETVPPVVHPCRKVPFPLYDKLKAELDKLEEQGVITKVNTPTDWVNSLVIVPKKNGNIRMCIDPRDLNRAIKRQHYKLPTREEITAKFAGAKVFSKLDASQGFYQIKLDEASSMLCTFNTPYGRYRYLRLPFGIASAPEVYHKIIHELFDDMPYVDTSMDDIIIWGPDTETHDNTVTAVLNKAREVNLKLNPEKCVFGMEELTFIGDKITQDGVKPDQAKVSAINNFPTPECKEDIQRLLGMVNYLAKWLPDMSTTTAPIRKLLDKNNEFQWGPEQDRAFHSIKTTLTSDPVLQYYDSTKPIRISADASKDGLGAVLLQQHDTAWKPVAYASRAMTSAERNYAQVEKELLGIVAACERFHQYIYGASVEVETDHKPLVSIFKKPLNNCPLRVQRLLLRVQRYDLKVFYTPGKFLVTADALSRAVDKSVKPQSSTEEEVTYHIASVLKTMPISDERMTELQRETAKDPELAVLQNVILSGWPQVKQECPPAAVPYWNVREELSVANGIILRGSKMVIPATMRSHILKKIHEGHLGIEKCRRRARDAVYWPQMNSDISNLVENCSICLRYKPNQQKEPLQPHELPIRPWQRVGTDLCSHEGKEYLVVSDYLSNYPEVIMMNTVTSKSVIIALKSVFARHGIPEVLISDNGPQYASSEFKDFAREWGFTHQTSSPHFPQSNGLAESSVKTVKGLLKKSDDFYKGLLAYRATPLNNLPSPAEMLMGRKLRTTLPMHPAALKVNNQDHRVIECKYDQKLKQKEYYDRSARSLVQLQPGDHVHIKDYVTNEWKHQGTVTQMVAPRSYEVHTDNGAILRRNRIDIRSTPQKATLQTTPQKPVPVVSDKDKPSQPVTPRPKVTECPVTVRKSARQHVKPKRLIEDM